MKSSPRVEAVPGKNGWKHFTLENRKGMVVSFLNIGGAITSIVPPGWPNVVLRYEDLHKYEENPLFLGAIVGPVAGRIKEGRYERNGKSYELTKNEGRHHLHGGEAGLHRYIWDVEMKGNCAVLTTECTADGYPGTMTIQVTYTLSENNQLSIDYYVEVTETRPVALTNHTYFNLGRKDISGHSLRMPSSFWLELDNELIPTGKTHPATGAFDFRKGLRFQEGFREPHPQRLITGGGYDHFFFLNLPFFSLESGTGRRMDIWTDQAGVQVYTGNNISETIPFHEKKAGPFAGVCLETQNHPVALHDEKFPSLFVTPGAPSRNRVCFTFSG